MSPQQRGAARVARAWLALPWAAACLFTGLALHAGRVETPTVDEFAHLPAGHAVIAHGDLELYAKNPPLGRALLALPRALAGDVAVPERRGPPFGWGPWQYGRRFMRANATDYFAIFASGRAVSTALALLAAAILFRWARELFGEPAAALSCALFLLSPTLLAHAHLATLDVACAASVLASVFAARHAWRGDASRAWPRLALAGALWGIALLVKFTAALLLPVWIALAAFERRGRWRRAVGELALFGAVALAVANAGMAFRGSFAPLGDYRFGSDFARALQAALPAATPVPLPRDWLRGFDAQKRDVERGEFPAYLHGEWSREGFWDYELIALALKTPLPTLALLALAPFAWWRRPPASGELPWLLLPVAVLGVLLVGWNRLNVGIRYLLPLAPFAWIAIAAVWRWGGRRAQALGLLVLALQVATALRIHPGYLGYFNALAGGPEGGHRWLLDSNLDWGQDLYRLAPALAERGVTGPIWLLYFGHVDPALYGIDFRVPPDHPVGGTLAASVSYLKGFAYPAPGPRGGSVRIGEDRLAWLRDREPVARLGSIWLFELPEPGGAAP